MKHFFIIILALVTLSCSVDGNDNSEASYHAFIGLEFTHNWDGTPISKNDFNELKFNNANGEKMSISALRYYISDVSIYGENDTLLYERPYKHLVDLSDENSLVFGVFDSIPIGNYSNVSFRFGIQDSENYTNDYYMQLEGKFLVPATEEDVEDEEIEYQYYTNRAIDTSLSPNPLPTLDTSIVVDLGSTTIRDNKVFIVKMNVAEWFKNPNQWDLNALHSDLSTNYDAQIMMNENGQNVFSLAK